MTPTARARRALLAIALVVAGACGVLALVGAPTPAAALAAPAVCADEGPCVEVRLLVAGESRPATHSVSASDLARWRDVFPEADYQLRYRPGGATSSVDDAAVLAVRTLVERLGAEAGGRFQGLSPSGLAYVTLQVPRGRTLTLRTADLGAPGDNGFVGGLMPAVTLNTSGSGSGQPGFIRPLRPDPSDVNAFETDTATTAPLVVTMSATGRPLRPELTATPTAVTVGQSVSLRTSVDDPPSGTTYTYDFGDGPTQTAGSTVTHSFTAAGTYPVGVDVASGDGSFGRSETTVTVTDPADVRPTISVDEDDREVGQRSRFSVTFATKPAGRVTYSWRVDGVAFSTDAAPLRTWTEKGAFKVQLEVTVAGRLERSNVLTVRVGTKAPEPTDGPSTPGGSPDPGGTGTDPDDTAPTSGPDAGDGGQAGGTPSDQATGDPGAGGGDPTPPTDQADPTAPAVPTGPGTLSGILLTGASTPLEVLPVPEAATDAGPQASAPGARARTSPSGSGSALPWAWLVVPLLLLVGVARETGWGLRLRNSSARAMMSR